mmetsp:Transcript_48323/g.112017  ORF Transcript_48323/g.112017 Transcript_48323/m.112017 type:complete len:220 (+) Transcript_48323:85-744(+)
MRPSLDTANIVLTSASAGAQSPAMRSSNTKPSTARGSSSPASSHTENGRGQARTTNASLMDRSSSVSTSSMWNVGVGDSPAMSSSAPGTINSASMPSMAFWKGRKIVEPAKFEARSSSSGRFALIRMSEASPASDTKSAKSVDPGVIASVTAGVPPDGWPKRSSRNVAGSRPHWLPHASNVSRSQHTTRTASWRASIRAKRPTKATTPSSSSASASPMR